MPAGNMVIVNMRLSRVFNWKTPLEPLQGLVGNRCHHAGQGAQLNMRIASSLHHPGSNPSHLKNSTAEAPPSRLQSIKLRVAQKW